MGFRALVLGAGRGMRLRPLTEDIPKPLLPVAGDTPAGLALDRLAAAGCEAAAINLHHLGEKVREHFGETRGEMPLTYSEEPQLLGTLGALAPLAAHLSAADAVVVINGDSLCRWPVERLLARHRDSGARATLLLSRRADPRRFGGGVGVDRERRIVSFRRGGFEAAPAAGRYVFAGAHVLSPDLLEAASERPADIVTDLYEPLLAAGSRLDAVFTSRRWHDLGTPERYRTGVLDWVQGPRPWPHSWLDPAAHIVESASVTGSVVEAGVEVEAEARVEGSLLLPGARVGRGAVVERSVLGFGAHLAPGTRVEGRMVTAVSPRRPPGSDATVVGEVAYTPLDPGG